MLGPRYVFPQVQAVKMATRVALGIVEQVAAAVCAELPQTTLESLQQLVLCCWHSFLPTLHCFHKSANWTFQLPLPAFCPLSLQSVGLMTMVPLRSINRQTQTPQLSHAQLTCFPFADNRPQIQGYLLLLSSQYHRPCASTITSNFAISFS